MTIISKVLVGDLQKAVAAIGLPGVDRDSMVVVCPPEQVAGVAAGLGGDWHLDARDGAMVIGRHVVVARGE